MSDQIEQNYVQKMKRNKQIYEKTLVEYIRNLFSEKQHFPIKPVESFDLNYIGDIYFQQLVALKAKFWYTQDVSKNPI